MSFLSICLIVTSLFLNSPQAATQADLESVKQLEQQFNTALLKKDDVGFASLLADDIVHIGFEGKSAGKAEYMVFFKVGAWQYKKYEPSKVSIKLLGSAAVVTGRVDRTIVIENKETSGAFAFTHVWSKSGNRWLLTSSQLTTIPVEE